MCSLRGGDYSPSESPPSANSLLVQASADRAYTLDHLELLHHLDKNAADILMVEEVHDHIIFDTIFRNALVLPHLMDQILAISALHLSALPQQRPRKTQHLCQAAQLHDRALAAFHTADAAGDDGLYTCLFYSLAGLHSLFDTLSFPDSFSGSLACFVHFVHFQQKCRRQAQESSNIGDSPLATEYQTIIETADAVAQAGSGRDYAELSSRLETSGLDQAALEACRSAVKHLQWTSDMRRCLPVHGGGLAHLFLAWPALIPDSFIVLIEQRRPEALVVLAHYATLLGSRGDLWIFASSGTLLAQLISKHLGSFWGDWLEPGIPGL